jgi:hypothetical protein
MEEFFSKFTQKGLPGGPNELKAFTEGFITSSEGQWAYPGMNTLIPNAGGRITMQGVNYPVLGIDDLGNEMMMQPGEEYQFPGDSVYEIPMKKGGLVKMPKLTKKNKKSYNKKFSSSVDATSRLFTKSELFAKSKSKKKKVFDPNAKYQDGGVVQLDGYRFKKDANGNWIYESGAPVTDRGMIQRLTYEAKPVGSPVVQNAPKFGTETVLEQNKKKYQSLINSPKLEDQETAENLINNYVDQKREKEIYYPEVTPDLIIQPKTMNDLRGMEFKVNQALGFPMEKARLASEAAAGPGEDPVDNFRHSNAGRYTAEAIANYTGNIPYVSSALGFLGANALGLGHEAMTLLKGNDKRDLSDRLLESGEDMYNNFIGAKVGASDMTPEEKTNYLRYLSSTNQLADGVVIPKNSKSKSVDNMYLKKGPNDPGKYKSSYDDGGEYEEAELTEEEIKEYRRGGWIVEEIDTYKKGGESKRRKKDNKGRYRSEDGNVRTPLTPEMQAEMSPEEWGQYVQEVPEVYTTRTKEQQEAMNAARNMQLLNELNYQRAPHLYLPDGSLRPQAAEAADWVWQLGMTGPAALKGVNAAMKIPLGAGVNVGGVLNAGMLAHGATQVDDRYQDWQDVAEGNMDWKEAALKTGMTALELSPAYGAAKKLLPQTYKINPFAGKLGTYNRVVGQDAVDDILESGLVRVNEDAGVAHDLGPFGVIKRTTPYPSFAKALPQKQYANQVIAQGKKPYIISTDRAMKASNLGRHGKGSTQFPIDETGKYMSGFPASEAKVFEYADKPHWLRGYKEVPKELPGSPNSTIMKSGMLNPLALADAIVPRLPHPIRIPLMGMAPEELGPFTGSPLNFLPGYGKNLGKAGNAFRKFGNTMENVQNTKTLSPKGGSPFRMGKDQIVSEGNWAALNGPAESYSGTFAAEFDFAAPGSNLGYLNPPSRNGVLITDRANNTLVDVPVSDPGLSFHRRLPFSNRYVPINKEKLLNNKFQLATQGGHFQSLVEKYGYGLAYAGLLGAMGYDNAVKTYNKYTIDPVINEAKKIINNTNTEIVPKEEFKKGGVASPLDLNPETMKKYREILKVQENSLKSGYRKAEDKWYPHKSPEGGKDTVGFGHKLIGPDAYKYTKGLTTKEAENLLDSDILKHQTVAKNLIDTKYGKGTFDSLPQDSQMLLVDYAYNGVLNTFPTFTDALVKGDKTTMLKEYKRYSGSKLLGERNEWTRSVIEGLNAGTAKTNTPKTLPAKTAPKQQPVKQPVKKPIAQPKFSSNETFSYDYRPDAVYRVADSGDWYINTGKNTHNEFVKLNDPTGKRTETLRKFAHINEVPLDEILNRINNSGNYDLRQDMGYFPE